MELLTRNEAKLLLEEIGAQWMGSTLAVRLREGYVGIYLDDCIGDTMTDRCFQEMVSNPQKRWEYLLELALTASNPEHLGQKIMKAKHESEK